MSLIVGSLLDWSECNLWVIWDKAISLFEPGVSGEDATGKSTERNLKEHALSFQVKSHLTDLNDHINGHMNDHDSKGFVMSVVREVLHSCSFFIYMYMMHLTAIVEIYWEDWITCERYFRIFCCCERKREKGPWRCAKPVFHINALQWLSWTVCQLWWNHNIK